MRTGRYAYFFIIRAYKQVVKELLTEYHINHIIVSTNQHRISIAFRSFHNRQMSLLFF